MNATQRVPVRRKAVRRAVVLLPNGLTLFNLFCGIYAIIVAIRGDFAAAPAFIVLGGIADTLDGRVARATRPSSVSAIPPRTMKAGAAAKSPRIATMIA